MIENKPRRILIAPLDWGLGHTTRCLPLIRYLQSIGKHVIVACNDSQQRFIERTVKDVEFTRLEGYGITYSKSSSGSKTQNVLLLPRISSAIKKERRWLQENLETLSVDGIIADNRYGLYTDALPCAIITHQLQIQTGAGKLADSVMQRIHYTMLEKFRQVWVPDTENIPNLSGILGHASKLPCNTRYMGLLSQFEPMAGRAIGNDHLLVLLSGPEPQRGIIAEQLLQQLREYSGEVIFVAGSDDADVPTELPGHITFHKTLVGDALSEAIMSASLVIMRSGYSSVMDMVLLGKKAILIPTPGQTEQEYLATYLQEQHIYPCFRQKGFNLQDALKDTYNFDYQLPHLQEHYGDYKLVIDEWLKNT